MFLNYHFQNHVVERFWPDINRLVNYPLKTVLSHMSQRDEIDMSDPHDKYIISQLSLKLVNIGRVRFVSAWNNKNIPRKYFD